MNKLFTKIATAFVGIAMAIGVGVAVASNREAVPVHAAVSTRYTLDTAKTKIATSSTYDSYTDSTNGWAVTLGSMQSTGLWLGSNSGQKAKMRLDSNGAGGGSISGYAAIASAIGVQSSATYYAAIIQTANSISNVDTVNLTYTTPGGTAPSEAWILYSTNSGSSWSVFKKVTSLSTSGTTFTHSNVTSARYAFVIHSTNYCQFKVPVLTFKGTDASTQSISGPTSGTAGTGVVLTTNATSSTQWTITANTCGASLSANTGTSVTVNATSAGSVTIQATCGSEWTTATHTIEFAAADAESITVTGSSSLYVGDSDITLTATPENFSPATYTWNSSNTGVATISGSGATATLHAVSKGTTIITASASGTGGTVTSNEFTATIKKFSIELSSTNVEMTASKSTTVTVTPTDANGTVVVSAISNNTSVATVSISGTTITINSGLNGGVSTTISVSAKDNNGSSGYHQTAVQTINVSISAGYTIGSVVTSLPSTDTLVYLIGNRGGATEYFVTSGITTTSTNEDNAALYLLSSSGTLRYYNEDAGTYGNYISHGSKTSVVSVSSNPTEWTIGNEINSDVTYENLILDGDRFLSDNSSDELKAYATSNLGNASYHEIRAYLAVPATPSVALSGDSVTGLKGNPTDTSLTLTISNFTATGLNVSYKDSEESSFSESSSVASVSCGYNTGANTVSISFKGIGSTTVKLSVTRGSGDPIEKTFTVSVSPKPASITINNTLKDGYLEVRNSNSASTYGYQQLDITAKDTDGNAYEGQLDYTVESGSSYVGLSDAHRVYGKAVGTGVVKVSAHALSSVYAEVNVKSMDDTKTGVKTVTFNTSLTANAGDALSISKVIATKKAKSYFGYSEGLDIDDSELLFSYSEHDYENAVPAASFIYACDEETAVDDSENQTVYVYCTLDSTWSDSFPITVTQTSNPVTGVSISNVSDHAKTITRTDSFQLALAFTPSNATNKNVTYSLSNQSTGSTITVSQTGLVSAGTRAGSTARVTVTTEDGGFTDYVNITVGIEEMSYDIVEPVTVSVASSISVGDRIFLAAEGTRNSSTVKKYMTGYTASYGQVSDYTDSPDASEAYVLDVVAGASNGQFAFKYGDNYLSYSGSSNTLNTTTELSAASSWTVSISNGKATITNANSTTRVIWYNASSPRFACYTNKSEGSDYFAPIIYKVSGGNSSHDVDAVLLNAVLDNFGSGKTYEWSESCETFNSSNWTSAGAALKGITGFSTYKLNFAVGNISGNEIEVFIAKYDNVVAKFYKDCKTDQEKVALDFLGRVTSGKVTPLKRVMILGDNAFNSKTSIIVVIVSLVSAASVGGYFFLRKKKED